MRPRSAVSPLTRVSKRWSSRALTAAAGPPPEEPGAAGAGVTGRPGSVSGTGGSGRWAAAPGTGRRRKRARAATGTAPWTAQRDLANMDRLLEEWALLSLPEAAPGVGYNRQPHARPPTPGRAPGPGRVPAVGAAVGGGTGGTGERLLLGRQPEQEIGHRRPRGSGGPGPRPPARG